MTADHDLDEVGAFFDRVAASYDTELPFFSTFAADLVAWHPLEAGASALDVCTGNGACLLQLARSRPRRLAGVDISSEMLARARDRCAAAGIPVELLVADAHHLPFENAAFDAFYCALSWHFLARPAQVVAELNRVGTDAAVFALSLVGPNRNTWPFLTAARARYAPDSFRRGRSPSRPQSVEETLQSAGWRLVDTSSSCQEFEFADAEHWLSWQWSHTGRALFEQVDEVHRPRMLHELLSEAEAAHRKTGLRIAQTVRFISASRRAP